MTRQIIRDIDNENEIFILEQELIAMRDKLKTLYWAKHNAIAKHGYSNGQTQTNDAIALGRIAEAQELVFSAAGCLQSIPRK